MDVLDADTHVLFGGYYEFYLSVQSSRFSNADTRVLFPLNVGNFQGCNSKFIQLPFELADDDELVFELVYQEGLSPEEQNWLLKASRSLGYCLAVHQEFYDPNRKGFLAPAYTSAAEILAEGINLEFRQRFKHLARGEWIAQASRPRAPQDANKLTLIEDAGGKKLARAQVRLYFPLASL